jgi:hypothetical protein
MLSFTKKFLLLNTFIMSSDSFILRTNSIIPMKLRNNLICMNQSPFNKTMISDNNANKSKIYKIEFNNEDDEYNELFRPKYIFGISDYQLVFIRMYMYLVCIYMCISQIMKK